jgi:hypothetical protein
LSSHSHNTTLDHDEEQFYASISVIKCWIDYCYYREDLGNKEKEFSGKISASSASALLLRF